MVEHLLYKVDGFMQPSSTIINHYQPLSNIIYNHHIYIYYSPYIYNNNILLLLFIIIIIIIIIITV